MNKAFWFTLLSIAMLCSQTILLASANPELNLSKFSALQREVSINADPISLRSFLSKLSNTNVQLFCEGEVKHQKLQMHLVNRPLYQIMDAVAELIPGEWAAGIKPGTYYFSMTDAAIHKEQQWWSLYDEAVHRTVKERQLLLKHLLMSPYKPVRPNVEISVEQAALQNRQNEPERAFFNSLSPDLQKQIMDSQEPLKTTQSQVIIGDAPDMLVPFNSLSDYSQKLLIKIIEQSQGTGSTSYSLATLQSMNPPVSFQISNYLFCNIVDPSGKIISRFQSPDDSFSEGKINSLAFMATWMNQKPLLKFMIDHPKQTSYLYSSLAQYQESTVWKSNPPEKVHNTDKPLSIAKWEAGTPISLQRGLMAANSDPIRRSDLLNWIEKYTGMEYLSDYYSCKEKPMTLEEQHRKLAVPITEELDRIEASNDCSWKKDSSGITLLRANRWYQLDRLEVPDSILTKWIEMLPRDQESYQSMVSDMSKLRSAMRTQLQILQQANVWLSPFQQRYGLRYFVREDKKAIFDPMHPAYVLRPFEQTSILLRLDNHFIKFFSSLTPNLQTLLIHRNLSTFSLNTVQAENAIYTQPQIYFLSQNPGLARQVHLEVKLLNAQFFYFGQLPNPGMDVTANGCLPGYFPTLTISRSTAFSNSTASH